MAPTAMTLAPRVERSLSWPPVQIIAGDVCGVEASPEAVAKWLWVTGHGDFSKPPRLAAPYDPAKAGLGWGPAPEDWLAKRIEHAIDWPPTIISNADASTVEPGILPEGTVVLFDPPYLGDGSRKITGYKHTLTREQVVTVAKRWSDSGALVCVCECVPIRELEGWHYVDISGCRVGQKRTFSADSSEWLTLNRSPAWTPPVQGTLW